jgi:hypothetical protein
MVITHNFLITYLAPKLLLLLLVGKDIVFRFTIEYSGLRDFGPPKVINNRSSIFIWGFWKDDILAYVETWDSLHISNNVLKDFGFF